MKKKLTKINGKNYERRGWWLKKKKINVKVEI